MEKTSNDTELLSRQEVANMLKVTPRTIVRWEEKKLLTPIRLSSRIIRYSRNEVEELLANSRAANESAPETSL